MSAVSLTQIGYFVNIRELARRSGVSTATVSRALNDRAEVSDATRERIRRLASELGYAPNEPARTLVRRRSDTIGLIWDSGQEAAGQHNPFLLGLLSAVRTALSEADYHLMLLTTPAAEDPDGSYLQAVRRHNLEGVIVLTTPPDDRCLRVLAASSVPCAGIDTGFTGPRTVRVSSDNAAGAEAAVDHLYALGHRRIATITGPLHLPPAAERLAGYLRACERLGLPVPPEYVTEGDFFLASGEAAARSLLRVAEPPTAIFAAGDQMAIGAIHAAADAGLAVPRDLAVVGFDDIDAAALVRPALTTVAQDQRALGEAAVAALRGLLDAGPVKTSTQAEPRIVPTRLLIRGSSRPKA
ncbi:LacI family DNA-binding transcriptional regulator [Actinacidiphila sp. ITFR-21]|uniref:LacI family DNA-binding transcriptional regulator n=1 Tax=Actinacidiphila sp. ITFR-21 TaxID=3075199 RepID=UPI00288B2709|nr:LacI family DNA-binding transcriptional regulator [Streptomyces sp. ITFR-21]WNI19353.1 LacI family DNA-binding transcriptional regulator [Streptomyces sp. ITFR-21]